MKAHYKQILAAVGSLVVFILMFMWLTGSLSGEKIAPGKEEVPGVSAAGLETVEVKAITQPVTAEMVGTVTARDSISVSSRVMATITRVNADAGDTVKQGQALFVLDSRDAQARLTQAQQAVASAEAALQRATADAGRIERLYQQQAATKQELDSSQAAMKMASASLDSARAAVQEAEVNLSFTKVTAPASGRVIDRLADSGDMAAPGKTLMTIYVPSTLRLEVPVAEQLRSRVNIGDEVRAKLDAVAGDFQGKITEVVPASDIASRSFLVRASIPSSVSAYPGMYGRIWIPLDSNEIVVVPPDAIRRVGQLEMVTVVRNGLAASRMIKTGKTYPEGVEVLSGLTPGEVVAINNRLKDIYEQ